ncbi:MAG: 30S ribosomal protein S17 [Thermaerobacter sp.]|jgi:small subunit ribosomal protein S17|nr:30S ribosomal protein S17 [Thermaerobacter sp.]MDA8146072.1 30S ribosomal protein S17 [Thermaerobacter sp.]
MEAQGLRKTRVGRVVSDKMDKTVVVAVERITTHPLYGRRIRRTARYKAHDPENACRVGDTVRMEETRPLSKDKRWRVVKILERPQV